MLTFTLNLWKHITRTYIQVSSTVVEQVSVYKLLGVMVNSGLKCEDHIAAIKSKAFKRLCFMKKLKRAGVSVDDLLYYYQTVLRLILEYACPA